MKAIPNNEANFKSLISSNKIYVDKTRFIEELEHSNFKTPLFLRPRRFGKSLFTSTLAYYYDIAQKDQFEKLFANTYIGKHPTPNKNSFYILRFDFGGLEPSKNLEHDFIEKIHSGMLDFFLNYPEFKTTLTQKEKASSLLLEFMNNFKEQRSHRDQKIFLIIDEYDNFTNNILVNDSSLFTELTTNEGFYRAFFAQLKSQLSDLTPAIHMIYTTGVMSIAMSAITSGYNAINISALPQFHKLAGFTEQELREVIRDCVDFNQSSYNEDQIIAIMKELYDGYLFNSDQESERLFNSTLCLNFLRKFQLKKFKRFDYSKDPDLDIDLTNFDQYLNLVLEPDRKLIIDHILQNKALQGELTENLNVNSRYFQKDEGISILYYLGYLTQADQTKIDQDFKHSDLTDFGYFTIPNKYFYDLLINYISKSVLGDKRRIESDLSDLAYTNDLSLFKKALLDKLLALPTFGKIHDNERLVAALAYTVIKETKLDQIFDFKWEYFVSNYEHPKQTTGRIDMLLINKLNSLNKLQDQILPSYLFEFKILKESSTQNEFNQQELINNLIVQATDQLLSQYLANK